MYVARTVQKSEVIIFENSSSLLVIACAWNWRKNIIRTATWIAAQDERDREREERYKN